MLVIWLRLLIDEGEFLLLHPSMIFIFLHIFKMISYKNKNLELMTYSAFFRQKYFT